jgi:hypothetical protein
MNIYKAKVLRVIDGDTIDVDIDLGFSIVLHKSISTSIVSPSITLKTLAL